MCPSAKKSPSQQSQFGTAIEDAIRLWTDDDLQISWSRPEIRERVKAGTAVDELPTAFGAFGTTLSNPIPVNGPIGELVYLSRLRQAGKKILFQRLGSVNDIGVYETVSIDGATWSILYFDMYHPRKSRKAPAGYSILVDADSYLLRGVNFEMREFPHSLWEAAATLSLRLFAMPVIDDDVAPTWDKVRFVRPDHHLQLVEQLGNAEFMPAPRAINQSELTDFFVHIVKLDADKIFPGYKDRIGAFLTERRMVRQITLRRFEDPALKSVMTACLAVAWLLAAMSAFRFIDAETLMNKLKAAFHRQSGDDIFAQIFDLAFASTSINTESQSGQALCLTQVFFSFLELNEQPNAQDLINGVDFLAQFSYPFNDRSDHLSNMKEQYELTMDPPSPDPAT